MVFLDWAYRRLTEARWLITVREWLCSHGLESRSERRFRTWFGPFLIWKPDFSPCERKAVSNQALEMRFDPPRRPDSRTCERKALSERYSCVCISKMRTEAMHNRMGQSARSKILPRSAQILIVIGKAFTMHVNARSSNHDPNHVLDRNPKRLSERDSSPC